MNIDSERANAPDAGWEHGGTQNNTDREPRLSYPVAFLALGVYTLWWKALDFSGALGAITRMVGGADADSDDMFFAAVIATLVLYFPGVILSFEVADRVGRWYDSRRARLPRTGGTK